jgi:hypothetical protein
MEQQRADRCTKADGRIPREVTESHSATTRLYESGCGERRLVLGCFVAPFDGARGSVRREPEPDDIAWAEDTGRGSREGLDDLQLERLGPFDGCLEVEPHHRPYIENVAECPRAEDAALGRGAAGQEFRGEHWSRAFREPTHQKGHYHQPRNDREQDKNDDQAL